MALGYKIGASAMMQLGTFQFSITTAAYQQLERSTAYRWASMDNLGRMSDMQNMGPENETMKLPFTIYPEFRGGLTQVDAMRAMQAMGVPLPMVDGSGASLGRWVILTVEETQSVFADAGKPRKIEGSLDLKRYPDEEATTVAADGESDIASGEVTAGTATGLAAKAQSLAASVSSAAASVSGTLSQVAADVQAAVAPITAVARDAVGGVLRATEAVTEIQNLANRVLAQVGVRPIDVVAMSGIESLSTKAAGLIVAVESSSTLLQNTSDRLAQISGVSLASKNAMTAAVAASNQATSLMRNTAIEASSITG